MGKYQFYEFRPCDQVIWFETSVSEPFDDSFSFKGSDCVILLQVFGNVVEFRQGYCRKECDEEERW